MSSFGVSNGASRGSFNGTYDGGNDYGSMMSYQEDLKPQIYRVRHVAAHAMGFKNANEI